MAQCYKTVLMFGAPGVGKGTQGKTLGAIPGFYHCACGDVFRSIHIKSELGKIFYEYSSRGELVPDDFTVQLWENFIGSKVMANEYQVDQDLLVLDGIPRTIEQAKIMDAKVTCLKIIHLVCNDAEAMIERLRRRALKENRYDDADEKVIRNRWKVYEAETAPVLDHYPQDLIVEVDSTQSPAVVHRAILDIIIPLQDAHFKHLEG